MNVENCYLKDSFPHGKGCNFTSMNYSFSGAVWPGSKKYSFSCTNFRGSRYNEQAISQIFRRVEGRIGSQA